MSVDHFHEIFVCYWKLGLGLDSFKKTWPALSIFLRHLLLSSYDITQPSITEM